MTFQGKTSYQNNMAKAIPALASILADASKMKTLVQSANTQAHIVIRDRVINQWYYGMLQKPGVRTEYCATSVHCDQLNLDYDIVIAKLSNGEFNNPEYKTRLKAALDSDLLKVSCEFLVPMFKDKVLASGVTKSFFTEVFVVDLTKVLVDMAQNPGFTVKKISSINPNIYPGLIQTAADNFETIKNPPTSTPEDNQDDKNIQALANDLDSIKNDLRGANFDAARDVLHNKYDNTYGTASVSAVVYQLAHCAFVFDGVGCHPDKNTIEYVSILQAFNNNIPGPVITSAQYMFRASKLGIADLDKDQCHILTKIGRCLIKANVNDYSILLKIATTTTDRANALKALADNAEADTAQKVDICTAPVVIDSGSINLADTMRAEGVYNQICPSTPTPASTAIKGYLMGEVTGCGDDPTTP